MTVAPVVASASAGAALLHFGANIAAATWTNVPNGESSVALALANYMLASAQVAGTFGVGGSIQLEGSNDNATWAILKDVNGTSAVWTGGANTVFLFQQGPLYIRPHCTAGDGTTAFNMVVSLRKQALGT